MKLFLDSSALAKRYIVESGTERVNSLCREASEILLSVLSVPEVLSAFNRLVREKKVTPSQYRQLKNNLLNDVAEATIIGLTESLIARAILCFEKVPLKSSDAIHVASALEEGADLFISADKQQIKAAVSLGLKDKFIR